VASKRAGEFERIARLAELFAAPPDPSIARGIGDDAAVLVPRARQGDRLVWTIDAQVEGVHFRRDLASWEDVGWRSFMAAASDVAAMGASPWCALSALVLDAGIDEEALCDLARGQAAAAREVGAPVVGGNLSRGGETSITTTLLGTCARPLERVAHAGDGVWIAGALGLAAAGLLALERKLDEADPNVAGAVLAWRRPRARVADAKAMSATARGAIDVSDGLAQDLGHVARASGLRVVLEERPLLAHLGASLGAVAARLGVAALDLALHGGEDYALVAASDRPIKGFARVGRFEHAALAEVALEDEKGALRAVEARGFDHFR